MASKTESFSQNPDRDAELIRWWKSHTDKSRVVLEALQEKKDREEGKETTSALVRKIWTKLQDMEILPTGVVELTSEDDDDLSHLAGALDALDMFAE